MGNKYDWEAIEKDYRVKKYGSIRSLAKEYPPVTEAAIRFKAKGNPEKGILPWEFDLVDDYQRGVREKLLRETSQCEVKNSKEIQQDKSIIENAVEAGVEIVRGHRKKAKKLGSIFDKLSEMVEGSIINEKLNEFLELSKGTHESIFDMTTKLSRIAESIVKIEREAYNLNIKEKEIPRETLELEELLKSKMRKDGFNI